MKKLFLTILLCFNFCVFSTEDNFKEGDRRFEIRGRLFDSSDGKLDPYHSFRHEYMTMSEYKNGQWVENQTLSIGFHRKNHQVQNKKLSSGFQNETNTKNSRVLSYQLDQKGKIYEELLENTPKYENRDFHLLRNNCGTYLGQLVSNSNLTENIKKNLLNKTVCFNNLGMGKSEIPQCKSYFDQYQITTEEPFSGLPNDNNK